MKIDHNVSDCLKNRDSNAIRDLILWYQPLLREMADKELNMELRSKVAVSDIVQDACTDVVRGFPKLKALNRAQFYSYLRRVMHNTLEDVRRRFIRTRKRRIRQEISLEQTQGAQLHENVHVQPIDKMMTDEMYQQLSVVLGKLPRELQRLLRWRFRKQLSYKEIGEKLDRGEDDVRMLINRCLARIRLELCRDASSQ